MADTLTAPLASPAALSATPDISVIIVSWNASKYLEECLDSLSRGISCAYEVIVVDNASSDGSPDMVEAKFPWVTLIRSNVNLGFSKGNNVGIARSRGKYLALVNSDVNVFPSCLDLLVAFMDKHRDVGMLGPRILFGDRRQQSSCRLFPTLWNNFCEVFYLNKVFPRSKFFSGEHMFYFGFDEVREVEVLVGCFVVARREATDQFGLLDEGFFFYGEDIDWSQRCRDAGWKVMFDPEPVSVHYCGGSTANDPIRFSVAQLKARLQLWAKHKSPPARLMIRFILTAQCLLRLVSSIIPTKPLHGAKKAPGLRARTQVACLKALWF
ncbi:MAG: glycosyl transferase family 2 [Verrucomicrobia bacterium]|nr:glycosyl transferase family 2 [Verrucomicrobiota bacterium]